MKILVILFIIIVSFIIGYQTKNDVLKDERLNDIREHEKTVRIQLNDMFYVLDQLYDNQNESQNKIYEFDNKNESQNKNRNKPVNTITVKIQVPREQYSRELKDMYYDNVRKMLQDKINDKIKIDSYFDPQWGLYNIYAFLNLNNFTSK